MKKLKIPSHMNIRNTHSAILREMKPGLIARGRLNLVKVIDLELITREFDPGHPKGVYLQKYANLRPNTSWQVLEQMHDELENQL